MSLFICSKCGCVENTNLIHGKEDDRKYSPDATEEYPCYCLQDMHGYGRCSEITMLCSECNTGTWHGEFTKEQATEEEKYIGSHSKYGMITYYDHPDELFIRDPDAPLSMRLRTPEEIEQRKKSRKALGNVVALAHTFGATGFLNKLHGVERFANQAEEEKGYYLELADYKRKLKEAKKAKRDKEVILLNGLISRINAKLAEFASKKKIRML